MFSGNPRPKKPYNRLRILFLVHESLGELWIYLEKNNSFFTPETYPWNIPKRPSCSPVYDSEFFGKFDFTDHETDPWILLVGSVELCETHPKTDPETYHETDPSGKLPVPGTSFWDTPDLKSSGPEDVAGFFSIIFLIGWCSHDILPSYVGIKIKHCL